MWWCMLHTVCSMQYVQLCIPMCTHAEARGRSLVSSSITLVPYCLEKGSLAELVHPLQQAGWPVNSRDHLCISLKLQVHEAMTICLHGCWGFQLRSPYLQTKHPYLLSNHPRLNFAFIMHHCYRLMQVAMFAIKGLGFWMRTSKEISVGEGQIYLFVVS